MELRKAKQSFFKKLQATDSKTFWKLYKTLTKKESFVPALLIPDVGVVSDDAIFLMNTSSTTPTTPLLHLAAPGLIMHTF